MGVSLCEGAKAQGPPKIVGGMLDDDDDSNISEASAQVHLHKEPEPPEGEAMLSSIAGRARQLRFSDVVEVAYCDLEDFFADEPRILRLPKAEQEQLRQMEAVSQAEKEQLQQLLQRAAEICEKVESKAALEQLQQFRQRAADIWERQDIRRSRRLLATLQVPRAEISQDDADSVVGDDYPQETLDEVAADTPLLAPRHTSAHCRMLPSSLP